MPEFAEGYQAYQLDGAHRLNPYDSNSVSAQAGIAAAPLDCCTSVP
jgi:hypothetical protein